MARVYLAKIGDTETLVKAGNINAARNHIAGKLITVSLASQDDLFRLAKGGAEIVDVNAPTPQTEVEAAPEKKHLQLTDPAPEKGAPPKK